MRRARSTWRAILAVLAVVAILPAAAVGQGTPGGVLTVDPERLFEATRFGRRVISDLEQRAADLQAENRRIEAALTAEERDLTERRPDLPPEEFRVLADAFDAKVDAMREDQDGKARELQRLRETGQQQFFQSIGPILTALVRDRGAAVLVDRRSVILATETVDITESAIRRIDAELGEGQTSEPGAGALVGPSDPPAAPAQGPAGNEPLLATPGGG